jgi:hypothetical protein
MGSQVGSGEGTAEESPPAGRVTDETDYFRFADDSPRSSTNQFGWLGEVIEAKKLWLQRKLFQVKTAA